MELRSSTESDQRTFLVAGGTGVAGECVVRALLDRQHKVVVPSRSIERLQELQERLQPTHSDNPNLLTVTGRLDDADDAIALRERIVEMVGGLNGVVASLGGWWEGAELVDVCPTTWHGILNDNLTAHFITARTFLPLLAEREQSVYVTLAGIAAELPVPHSGPISVTGAAQRMMIRTLAREAIGQRVRLHELAILTPIVTPRWTGGEPEPGWLRGEQVGQRVVEILAPDSPDAGTVLLAIP